MKRERGEREREGSKSFYSLMIPLINLTSVLGKIRCRYKKKNSCKLKTGWLSTGKTNEQIPETKKKKKVLLIINVNEF